jgi:TM2 domain-containing membrane protein YozV
MSQERSNAAVAAVFSFIFSGLGQIYNGQIIKGLVIIFLSTLSLVIFIVGAIVVGLWIMGEVVSFKIIVVGSSLLIGGLIFICILGLYSIFDAYNFNKK